MGPQGQGGSTSAPFISKLVAIRPNRTTSLSLFPHLGENLRWKGAWVSVVQTQMRPTVVAAMGVHRLFLSS